MPGLVPHVAAEVPADDAVLRGVVLLVELLDVGRDVLLRAKANVFDQNSNVELKSQWILLNIY